MAWGTIHKTEILVIRNCTLSDESVLFLRYYGRKILWKVELSILFIDKHATLSYAPTGLDIGFIFINELDK